jgi:hypothetical protein
LKRKVPLAANDEGTSQRNVASNINATGLPFLILSPKDVNLDDLPNIPLHLWRGASRPQKR